jgi:hypothetical protein
MKNGDPCTKERCLKETNHDYKPGVYLGKPFVYEDCWLACEFCMGMVAQPVERLPEEQKVTGATPVLPTNGSVEQVVSSGACKALVSDCGGSIPSAPTIKKKGLVF